MSSTNAPFGLRTAYSPSGTIREFASTIASGYASDIYTGQPVKIASDGTLQAASAGDSFVGAFAGCQYLPTGAQRPVIAGLLTQQLRRSLLTTQWTLTSCMKSKQTALWLNLLWVSRQTSPTLQAPMVSVIQPLPCHLQPIRLATTSSVLSASLTKSITHLVMRTQSCKCRLLSISMLLPLTPFNREVH
jgi:hypothetical protein